MDWEVMTDIFGQAELRIFLTCDQWHELESSPVWHRLMEFVGDLEKAQERSALTKLQS